MHSALDQSRAEIERICARHAVLRLELFGSAARGNDFDPVHSDADFLVEFKPEGQATLESYFALKSDLEQLLRRPVDLLEPRAVRNPFLLKSINATRELVYAA